MKPGSIRYAYYFGYKILTTKLQKILLILDAATVEPSGKRNAIT